MDTNVLSQLTADELRDFSEKWRGEVEAHVAARKPHEERLGEKLTGLPPEQAEVIKRIANDEIEAMGITGPMNDEQAAQVERRMNRAMDTIADPHRAKALKRQSPGRSSGMTTTDLASLEARYHRELAGHGGSMQAAQNIVAKYRRLGLFDASIYDLRKISGGE